jgi:uncharacterized membrane protein YqjE
MVAHNGVAVRPVDTAADRPLKDLLSGLGKDMGLLVRQELELAKAELTEKASRTAKGAASIGIGAFLAYAGMLAVVAALVMIVIELGVTPWLAATIIGVVLLAAGYGILQGGRRRITEGRPTLERTKENAKETVHRLKEQLQ